LTSLFKRFLLQNEGSSSWEGKVMEGKGKETQKETQKVPTDTKGEG